ncbi:hypothetical protein IKG29_03555 [Candidatus Saccharibacteria bacterium]|nr:hypothetical protein [Candidatus Saccharibacteria bacterium]
MVRVGITDKRLANKRFKRTEEAILRAFFESDNFISIEEMARRAGVARSTIYVHHRMVREIIPDYERYILRKYQRMIREVLTGRDCGVYSMMTKVLIFILVNKKVFIVVLRGGGKRVIEQMIDGLREKLVKIMRLSPNQEKIFVVYKSEVVTLIEVWCQEGFNRDEIERVASEIVYLTETAKMRLGRLVI